MKYYEFAKHSVPLRILLIITYLLAFFLYPFVIWMFIMVVLGGINEEGAAAFVILAALYIASLIIAIYYIFSLKGVFVFDDHIEIKNGVFPWRYRNVDMENILDVKVSSGFRADEDAKLYYHYKNIIAGDVKKECVKIRFKRGGWQFVGVENPKALSEDIAKRKEITKG